MAERLVPGPAPTFVIETDAKERLLIPAGIILEETKINQLPYSFGVIIE